MALKLNARPGAPDEHDAFHGQLRVGNLYKRRSSLRPEAQWLWALNGVSDGPSDLSISGSAPDAEEALAGLTEQWRKWLEWAKLKEA